MYWHVVQYGEIEVIYCPYEHIHELLDNIRCPLQPVQYVRLLQDEHYGGQISQNVPLA